MNRENLVKVLSGIVAVIVILNIVLFAARKVTARMFWIVIALAAVFAYIVLPKLRKQLE
jgi:hypothetical protein